MAALQVLQRGVCDQGAVVQLDHLQTVVSAGAAAQVPDAIVGDELTVRETLNEPTKEDYSTLLCLHKM